MKIELVKHNVRFTVQYLTFYRYYYNVHQTQDYFFPIVRLEIFRDKFGTPKAILIQYYTKIDLIN